jgi:hypothetical protein
VSSVRRFKIFESEVERRGKLKSDVPGEFHFTDTTDAIAYVAGEVRSSHMKYSKLAANSGSIKSPTTVSKLASGETRFPRFSTMAGLGKEMVIKKRTLKGDVE